MRRRAGAVVAAACAFFCAAAGCTQPSFQCDTSRVRCGENVHATVLRQRGDAFDPFGGLPPIERITQDEYRERLLEQQRREGPRQATSWDVALALLALVPKGGGAAESSVEEDVATTAAYYSSFTKRVTLILREEPGDRLQEMSVLAHELVHAIQDRELDLAAATPTTDSALARRALVEGDAVLYETLAYAEFSGIDERRLEWELYFDRWAEAVRARTAASAAPYFVAPALAYPLGGRFLFQRFRRDGNAGVRALYGRAPRTTADLLATGPGLAEPAAPLEPCVAAGPPGFSVEGDDVFGAFEVYALLTRGLPEARAFALARTWRGDRIRVFDDGAGKVAVAFWIGVAPTAEERAALAAGTGARVEERQGGVLVSSASDPELLASWQPACATFTSAAASSESVARRLDHLDGAAAAHAAATRLRPAWSAARR